MTQTCRMQNNHSSVLTAFPPQLNVQHVEHSPHRRNWTLSQRSSCRTAKSLILIGCVSGRRQKQACSHIRLRFPVLARPLAYRAQHSSACLPQHLSCIATNKKSQNELEKNRAYKNQQTYKAANALACFFNYLLAV